jgi:DHA1 family bicyclomycin/chloramphenicol resistance-like MFS transporter
MARNWREAEVREPAAGEIPVAAEGTPVLEIPLDTAASPGGQGAVRAPEGARMLLILGALSAVGPASMDSYLPGLPALTSDLGTTASVAQVTIGAFLLGLGVGQVFAGPLSDAFGRRRPMLLAMGLYVVLTICCAFSPTIEVLIAGRFLQGATAAGGIVISRAVVRDLYGGRDGARFLSRLVLIYGLAPLLAPLVGGLILTVTDWRGIFVAMAVIGLALFAIAARWLPETLPAELRRRGGVAHSLRVYSSLMRDRAFVGYALALGLTSACIVAYISAAPYVLQNVYGISPEASGLFFAANGAAMIAGSQLNAHLVGHRDLRWLLKLAGFGLVAVGAALVLVAEAGLGVWAFGACLIVLMGFWGSIPANSIGLAMAAHPRIAGSASAVLGIFQYGLGSLSAPIAGIGGKATALPMALTILVLGLASMAAVGVLARGTDGRPD